MKAVLKVLKQQGLFFVDSSTYSKSIGDQVARSMGVPTARNNIFLDNSSDEDDIIAKIWQAVWRTEMEVLLPFVMPDRILPQRGAKLSTR